MVRTARAEGLLSLWILSGLVVFVSAPSLRRPETFAQGVERSLAREILDATGTSGGLIVHVGCGDGRLTAALCAGESYLVQGLDTQPRNVEKARRDIRSRGLTTKVSVDRFDGRSLPYFDGCVNLLVAGDLEDVSMDEVMRVLCPEGVAYIKRGPAWEKTVKPWPAQIDPWTHYLHGPDNNAVAARPFGGASSMSPRWEARSGAVSRPVDCRTEVGTAP